MDLEYLWSSFGWHLGAPEHRPGWMRVDRLLGEHGIQEDSAVGRQEFECHMEARRLEEADEEELKPLRRGWCLGSVRFRQEMLERMDGKLGENHSGELHRETAEQKANRILPEELSRRGWTESDLAARRRSDPGKTNVPNQFPVAWGAALAEVKGSYVSQVMQSEEGDPMVGLVHELPNGERQHTWLGFKESNGSWQIKSPHILT